MRWRFWFILETVAVHSLVEHYCFGLNPLVDYFTSLHGGSAEHYLNWKTALSAFRRRTRVVLGPMLPDRGFISGVVTFCVLNLRGQDIPICAL